MLPACSMRAFASVEAQSSDHQRAHQGSSELIRDEKGGNQSSAELSSAPAR